MRKMLRLEEMSAGGRRRGELYDLLGLRAVVMPKEGEGEEDGEEKAVRACYRLQLGGVELEGALGLWWVTCLGLRV
jgi:hypothetical protein